MHGSAATQVRGWSLQHLRVGDLGGVMAVFQLPKDCREEGRKSESDSPARSELLTRGSKKGPAETPLPSDIPDN